MSTTLHPDVERIGRAFRAFGMGTPATIDHKTKLILSPTHAGERVAVVVADAVRCSSTIIALMAAGAAGITVSTKDGKGPSLDEAQLVATEIGVEMVTAGELHGRPIPGGVVGNSPRDAARAAVHGLLVAFHSTNFGAAFNAVLAWRAKFAARGGRPTIVVATFANAERVSCFLRSQNFDRIAIATGGFYDTLSIEDLVVGGDVLRGLDCDESALDDEARLMVDASRARPDADTRIASFRNNWIGRSLERFGMDDDIAAVVAGAGISTEAWNRMTQQLPIAAAIAGVPVLLPAGVEHDNAAVPAAGGCHAETPR